MAASETGGSDAPPIAFVPEFRKGTNTSEKIKVNEGERKGTADDNSNKKETCHGRFPHSVQ